MLGWLVDSHVVPAPAESTTVADMTTVAIVMWVLGGFAELSGLLLVVKEIGDDRALAKRYLEEMPEVPSFGHPLGPQKPEVALMRNWERRQGTAEEQIRRAQAEYDREIGRIRDAAASSAHAQRDAFLRFVSDLLTVGLGRRRLGVGLLAFGMFLGVAGNLVSVA